MTFEMSGNPPGDILPRPDPTRLTTDQLRRELASLREILTARIDAMDRATELLSETVNRTPTVIQTEISHVRELIQEKLSSLGGRAEEKFNSIDLQFAERDVRTTQTATASEQALAAALQAAAKASEKSELSFTKQIDQIQLQIKTIGDGFGDRLAELKERIDRGEGGDSSVAAARSESRENAALIQAADIARGAQLRATISVIIAALSTIISIILAAVIIVHG